MESSIEIFLILAIILSGFVGLAASKNMLKSVLCLNITQTGIILLFLSITHTKEGLPPILPVNPNMMVDPTPQALVITTIVIGAAITSLALMLSIKIFHHYGTLDWREISERQG